ncbi:MAG: hypothetical protein ACYC1M_03995 [Armatimonadota bacterium]
MRQRLHEFLLRLLLVLSTGVIFVVFSELMFWGRYDFAGKISTEYIHTVLAYSFMAWVFLIVVRLFRVRSLYALFMAGAVFGWLCEGIFVQTMYDDFPLNISFTGLAWHSLLTVCCGWYLFRRLMLMDSPMPTLKVSVLAGLMWGLWSVWWWITKGLVSTPGEYALYAFITTAMLIVGLWLSALIPSAVFRPSKADIIVTMVIVLLFYLFVTIRANQLALTVLPVCMGLAFYALNKNRQDETDPDALAQLDGRVYAWNYAAILVMPVVSTVVYAILYYLHIRLRTGPVFYLVLTIAGFMLFFISFRVMVSRRRLNTAGAEGTEIV